LIGKRDQKHETINVKGKALRDCLAFEQYKRITLCSYIVDGCVAMSETRAEFSSELMGEVIETDRLRLRPFRSDDVRSGMVR
jgi:hypothetical protein